MSLAGRVALVTGGGRGIGGSIALALAEDGSDVAVNYRRDEGAAKETVTAIEALGRLFQQSKRQEKIPRLAKKQLKNPRNATRKKAEKFIKKLVDGQGR